MSAIVDQLASGRRLLLDLGGGFKISDRTQDYRGEIAFKLREGGGDPLVLDMTRLSVVSYGVMTSSGHTGKLSVCGIGGEATCTAEPGGKWSLTAEFKAEVLYRAIEDKLGFKEVDPGLLEPDTETFTGSLRATLAEQEGTGVTLLYSDLELTYQEGGLHWIRQLRIPVSALPPTLSFSARAAPTCLLERRGVRRALKLRPFAFRTGPNGMNHTGTSWPAQFAAAKSIWGACCLNLESDALVVLDNVKLLNSDDPRVIVKALGQNGDLDGIEVFLVDRTLPEGGGTTLSGGSALAKVVMMNRNAGNPNLLAHELGHVFAGLHPGRSPVGNKWVADPGTVLEPSNSPNAPNPSLNTLNNCRRARNPALSPTGAACCIQPTL